MNFLRNRVKILVVFLLFMLLVPVIFWANYSQNISLIQGEEHYVNIPFPLKAEISCDQSDIIKINGSPLEDTTTTINLKEPLSLKGVNLGNTSLNIKLFGVVPLRHLTVNVFPEKFVYPGGQSIGIKLRSEGVIVVGFNKVDGSYPAREMGLKKGDSIIAINGCEVDSIDEAAELIDEKGSSGKPIEFNLKRGNTLLQETIIPRYCSDTNSFRIGLYIRDTAAGVGTLSFYDPDSKLYGALGHVIVDIDTNTPININHGEIVKASIVRIKEGKRGHPGEKTGVFIEEKDIIGSIEKNTEYGIFGRLEKINNKNDYYSEPIPIALSNQVQVGPAEILTVLNGDRIEKFDVEIQRIVNPDTPSNKGFIIKITDENLINRTGGIIQGMSGSPIIQNNKLVGAVTHVFINDPTRGYGIFVEWMLQESGALEAKYVN